MRGLRSISILLTGFLPLAIAQAAESFSADGLEFFENRIRPVLVASCYECHSAEAGQSKGGLLLDTRNGLLKGGKHGPAVVVGQPEASRLVKAIHQVDDDLKMPPKKSLAASEVKDFEAWIHMGLPDPRQAGPAQSAVKGTFNFERERLHWAYQPVRDYIPPFSKNYRLARNYIDQFLLAELDALDLKPNPEVDKLTLIRRVTFDLTGLPPTPEDIDGFLADRSTDAYEKLVDRLLESPAFGERFGRHWLDLVRYADTAGDSADFPVPQAYRYRNYVIRAFNQDKPYDQFLREQIAGDLLPATSREQRNEQLIATGFIAISRRFAVDESDHHLTIDDTIDVLGKATLGLTVSCARCHDHKYDPIPTRDYYALHGIFNSTRYPFPGAEIRQRPRDLVPLIDESEAARILAPFNAKAAQLDADIAKVEAELSSLPKVTGGEQSNSSAISTVQRNRLTEQLGALKYQRKRALDDAPPIPMAYAVAEGRAADSPIFQRGDRFKPGPVVPRGFLQVLGGKTLAAGTTNSGRLELAQWVTEPANPLTARVMVNRVWQWHFGRGLVATPSDFGARGKAPSNPWLLDYLASRFVEGGWSVKKLTRLIVTSRAYRQTSADSPANFAADPNNDLVWRFNRQRLDAESIRDSILAVSGRLDPEPGGEHPFPPLHDWDFTQHFQFTASYTHEKRSVYLMQQRIRRSSFFVLFDGPDPNASMAERPLSITPLQALYSVNNTFIHEQATTFARRILAAGQTRRDRLTFAYRTALGRKPTEEEVKLVSEHLAALASIPVVGTPGQGTAPTAKATTPPSVVGRVPPPGVGGTTNTELSAWSSVARAILASNEFVFID